VTRVMEVLAPVREWPRRSREENRNYARRRRLPIEEPQGRPLTRDRNLWGVSLCLYDLSDAWEEPPADIFTLTRAPEQAPEQPSILTLGFESGLPRSLNGEHLGLVPLVRELNR